MTALSFRQLSQEYVDDYPNYAYSPQAFPEFWTVINGRKTLGREEFEKSLLKYLNDTIRLLMEWRRPIVQVQRLNTLLYRGKHYLAQDMYSGLSLQKYRNRQFGRNATVVLNYLGQAADQYVAEMSAFEPNLAVRPKNDEESDRMAARMSKLALDHYFKLLNMKTSFLPFHLCTKIHGEAFKFVLWDPSLGDVHPRYKELRDMKMQRGEDPDISFPLVDPVTGNPILSDDNKPIIISRVIKTGDVKVVHEYSERVLYPTPPSALWSDVPYIHRLILMPIDEVKARWPAKATEIRADSMYFDYMGTLRKTISQYVVVRYTYHKPTEFLPNGFTCYSTENCVLQFGDKEFNHDHLPCIRATDIDLPFEITGMSQFQNLATLNQALNNSTSAILQNQQQFAYPKYAVPRAAKVKYTDLGDDRGIYEYSGPTGPEIMAQNSTPSDTWQWRETMRSEFRTLAMLDNPSSGQAPKGITANVALRMLEEQHRKQKKPSIDKHGENCERLGELILSTLSTYRDPTDGSLISILGKNNERYLRYFDVTNLAKPYSVELIKTSGFPESPAAKTQMVMDLAAQFPGMWSNDEVLEQLDIARPEKLVESGTISRQSAESEVEDILSGLPVPPPQPYHDLLPRYRVYEKAVQARSFDETDPGVRQNMINHIMTTEYLMTIKMKMSPAFAQKVITEYPNFPMYFPQRPTLSPPMTLAQPLDMSMMGMGGAGGAPPLGGLPPEAGLPGAEMPPEVSQTPMPGNSPEVPMSPPPGQLP